MTTIGTNIISTGFTTTIYNVSISSACRTHTTPTCKLYLIHSSNGYYLEYDSKRALEQSF